MKRHQAQRLLPSLTLALCALTLVAVAANTMTTLKMAAGFKGAPPPSLPCGAVPTRLILEDPICAQKLLDSMNVTNVRIQPGETLASRQGNETRAQAQQEASQDAKR